MFFGKAPPSTSEDVVPTARCSIAVLCRLALEWSRLEMEASAYRWSELSTYCSAATLKTFFNYWYTLLTPFVDCPGRVSKSAAAIATFWLALGKVAGGVPSWLMATAVALALARALV
jgi:hypothetical protein